ncbi:MAG: hypothetical protein OEU36_18845 [Gammaproteobacteria bacterium]|nr:hypothetical protein [Gammaproteobacteria bacterium]
MCQGSIHHREHISDLTLEELRQQSVKVYRKGGGTRPDVLLLNINSERVVLKDHGGCDRWFAYVVGPLLARREARALQRLRGIHGVPDFIGRVGPSGILMEYVPGNKMVRSAEIDWESLFQRLSEIVASIHDRGIAHCDLRSRNNVLIDEREAPYIVDFVASIGRGRLWNPVSRFIFTQFCRADRMAISKLKHYYAPDLLTENERSMISSQGIFDRSARFVGHRVRDMSRWIFTKNEEPSQRHDR